jgi:hypothetical protein
VGGHSPAGRGDHSGARESAGQGTRGQQLT